MVEEVTPEDVRERLDDEELTVVDIRSPGEFRRGHVPGAINLPMRELTARVDEVEWSEEVVVVCPIGQSSIQAARLLGSYEGLDADAVKSMAGGYDAWEFGLETGADGDQSSDGSVDAEEAPF